MHRFTECTNIRKKVPKFSHWQTSQSQWRNSEIIIDRNFLNFLNHATQLFNKLFFTQLARIDIYYIINFIENYWHMIYKTNLSKSSHFTHIFISILCRFCNHCNHHGITKVLLCKWPTNLCMYFLMYMSHDCQIRNFACQLQLYILSESINSHYYPKGYSTPQ